jgi:hypothetical protein
VAKMDNSMDSKLFVVLLIYFSGFTALVTLSDFWSNRRRYGSRIARRLLVVIASELVVMFAILMVPLLFGPTQSNTVLGLGAWGFALLLGAQIVSMIVKQPEIDETSLDLGNPHGGMGQAVLFVFLGIWVMYGYLSDEQTRPWALPMIVICALSAVYFAACSVRNYYVTHDAIWTSTGKIKWEHVTVCQLDAASDGTPVLYVQARGGLPWRNRFASKVPAQDKAALVEYIERHASSAQAVRA